MTTQKNKLDKNELIKNAVEKLLQMFESGKFPEAVAMSVIRKREGETIPSDKWSLGNRLLMRMQGTEDARGYKQWQMIGRQVKKGTKAIYIFSPATKIITEKNAEGEEEKKIIIKAFIRCRSFVMKTQKEKNCLSMITSLKNILHFLMWQKSWE